MRQLASDYSYKLRFVWLGILMVGSLIFILVLPSLIWSSPKVQAAPASIAKDPRTDGSPNIISDGLFSSADGIAHMANSTQRVVYNSSRSVRTAVVSAATGSAHFVGHSVVATAGLSVHVIASSAKFIGHTAVKPFALASSLPSVNSIITPANSDRDTTPTIPDNPVSLLVPNSTAAPAAAEPQMSATVVPAIVPQWPIHGAITLEFGVVHWPFQPTHTGIDISDGAYSGVTAVHPFEPGAVIEANYNSGFGYHVIIDHGGGLTSLYGHMARLAVQVGQKVDESTVLGFEGSTGESTGVHVHFETDLNGQPVSPHRYVTGAP